MKTGSSVIQTILANLSTQLKGSVLKYPSINNYGTNWQAYKGLGAGNGEAVVLGESTLTGIVENLNFEGKLLISSEMLSESAASLEFWQELEHIRRRFVDKVRVVYYLRDPLNLIFSNYAHWVKAYGYYNDVSNFISENKNSGFALHQIHNAHRIFNFAANSNVDFEAFSFEENKSNIFEHFIYEACQISEEDFDSKLINNTRVNQGIGISEVFFLRGVNSINPIIGKHLGWDLSDISFERILFESKEPYSITAQAYAELEEILMTYKNRITQFVDKKIKVNFDLKSNKYVIDGEQNIYLEEIRKLGILIAKSLDKGYLNWGFRS